jgi:retron-type reverse transcriptase
MWMNNYSQLQIYIDFIKHNLDLDNVEEAIIQGTLEGKTYTDIIANTHLHLGETTLRDRGSRLWRRLSEHFRHHINKSTFLLKIQRIYSDRQTLAPSIYVNREPIETIACVANI